MLVVPLLREEEILGALVVRRSVPGAFEQRTVDLARDARQPVGGGDLQRRLYRELDEKTRELEVASQHKSDFLANMSHELRTPLNAVIGFSDVLLERMFGELNERQDEYLHDIRNSGRHLLELINEILDLSKVEAGRMELELGPVSLARCPRHALAMVRERAERSSSRSSSMSTRGCPPCGPTSSNSSRSCSTWSPTPSSSHPTPA